MSKEQLGFINQDLNKYFHKGDEVIINIVDNKSQLFYVYNLENDHQGWIMMKNVDSEY